MRSATAAVRGGPSGSTSGSCPSASTRGRPGRPATGSSTSTTSRTRRSRPRSSTSSSGAARPFELDGERVDAPAGTFVFARPGVKRTAFAEEPGTTVVALGGTPGKAYEPSGWELVGPAQPALRGRQVRRGRRPRTRADRDASRVRRRCSTTSRAARASRGGTAEAIEHLRLAIDRTERFRSFAAGDSDLDPIRDEPAFKELMSPPSPE